MTECSDVPDVLTSTENNTINTLAARPCVDMVSPVAKKIPDFQARADHLSPYFQKAWSPFSGRAEEGLDDLKLFLDDLPE